MKTDWYARWDALEAKSVHGGPGSGIPPKLLRQAVYFRPHRARLHKLLGKRKRRKREVTIEYAKMMAESIEVKAFGKGRIVRRVRSAAGVKKFKQPIGSIIIAKTPSKPGGREIHSAPLSHIEDVENDYPNWEKVKGSDGEFYYTGQDKERPGTWVGTDNESFQVVEARNEADVVEALDAYIARKVGATKKAPAKKTPAKAGAKKTTQPKKTSTTKKTTAPGPPPVNRNNTPYKYPPGKSEPGGVYQTYFPLTDKLREDIRAFHGKHGAIAPGLYDVRVNPYWKNLKDPTLIAIGLSPLDGKASYVYNEEAKKQRAEKRFGRAKRVAKAMPVLDKALARDAPKKDEALAALTIRHTGMRVGNEASAAREEGSSYGVTTLLKEHVKLVPGGIRFHFTGKSQHEQDLVVKDPEFRRLILAKIKDKKPTDTIFDSDAKDISGYLRKESGVDDIVNKDIRTYVANVYAAEAVSEVECEYGGLPKNKTQYNKMRTEVGKRVAARLGNTHTVALGSYIDPVHFDLWKGGEDW